MAICMVMMGGSDLFDLPENGLVTGIGFILLGVPQIFVFIQIIPEMVERMRVDLNIPEGEDDVVDSRLNDAVNDAYGVVYALANFISPILGSMVYNQFGVTYCFDLIFSIDVLFAIFIFHFNCGPFVFKENREFLKRLNELRNQENQQELNSDFRRLSVDCLSVESQMLANLNGKKVLKESLISKRMQSSKGHKNFHIAFAEKDLLMREYNVLLSHRSSFKSKRSERSKGGSSHPYLSHRSRRKADDIRNAINTSLQDMERLKSIE